MIERKYQICTRCVMDTTDPDIRFDEKGVCNHCKQFDESVRKHTFTGDDGRKRLENIVSKIKKEGVDKEYNCIIGVSGGVDSTYVAYKVKELGLRPLAVHLDNGWDSELAVCNITNALKKLNIDLHTHVIDWEEFKDLQLSFLKASTTDCEIPSDHAIFALMVNMATKLGVKYILPGFNIRTESHLPNAWSQGHLDWKYIKSVHKQFGKGKLKTFPRLNLVAYHKYRYLASQGFLVNILNYIDYVKSDAKKVLMRDLGWKDYGGKHYESIYTRFYQGYILPKKFGYDKRKVHFSSLICSGQMTRGEALKELKKDPYPLRLQEEDNAYLLKKFGLSDKEFDGIMNLPKRTYWDYPSYGKLYKGVVYKTLFAGITPIYRLLLK